MCVVEQVQVGLDLNVGGEMFKLAWNRTWNLTVILVLAPGGLELTEIKTFCNSTDIAMIMIIIYGFRDLPSTHANMIPFSFRYSLRIA